METTKQTNEEIEQLKANWHADPCWDIEDTEGFEEHKQELYIYRLESELEWANEELQRYRHFKSVFVELFKGLKVA